MSQDGRRNTDKLSTGTVPKLKHRNNASQRGGGEPRGWPNNLSDRHNLPDCLRRNSRRCAAMNGAPLLDEQRHVSVNGSVSPRSVPSRRNSTSTVPKCDNLTKYPDKKQIEDKLTQIREYLQITTSLMSSMKNTDEQFSDPAEKESLLKMAQDLKDSENKLVNILENTNQSDRNDNYSETATCNSHHRNDLDEQISFQSLQQKAENRLRDARQIQEKLAYDVNSSINQRDKNFQSVQDFDFAIRELEERTKRLNEPRASNQGTSQDKLMADIDGLHNQILNLHNMNEEGNVMLQVLDNRDTELRTQHIELQNKLSELQNKKSQVDQLVAQLQNLEEGADEDDVAVQVRRIMTMKDQLAKLTDMLEIVKTTENIVQNGTAEEQELACQICTKAENILLKETEKRKTPVQMNEGNLPLSYDNTRSLNESRRKQVNKTPVIYDRQGAKPKSRSNANKVALQAELEAKKRELEAIMGKHKAATSNLNHDVGVDTKSEFSGSSNTYFDVGGSSGWAPILPDHNRFESSESDEEANEDYTDLPPQSTFTPIINYPQEKGSMHNGFEGLGGGSLPRTPERVIGPRQRTRSNSVMSGKNQVMKQLELIRNVCDSMLENPAYNNVRNNLTPSSLYSEPGRFTSPRPQAPWGGEPANYQGWLATNTLQTQAFMLNTLNQCCQMLWLQQRELSGLRQAVTQLQLSNEQGSQLASPMQQRSASSNQKANQVAAACSMPNLNQYNLPPSVNLDHAPPPSFQNNARLLDQCLNNEHNINNGVLHGVNANINPMWNGQALNNQVAPGNRANNYWDNFRSYSRQNLLSSKSNDPFQTTNNPFTMATTTSKSNSEHASSQENTPRRAHFRSNNTITIPPDVLNVNLNKSETSGVTITTGRNVNESEYSFAYNEISSNNSNISEEQHITRRNEWHEEQIEERNTKSKLFEELRDHVYKEVVTLISANEARPHFLIQLFRDLQMISSDPLRLKILQSIQTIITHSLTSTTSRQIPESQVPEPVPEGSFSLQSTVWSKALKNPVITSRNSVHQMTTENSETDPVVKEIVPFLNDHEDDIMTHPFLLTLKQVFLESTSFQEMVRDSVFKKHFSNVLEEVLTQYHGKKVREVKMHVLQTINDLLRGELSFIQLIQDTCPETQVAVPPNEGIITEMQNGDLAEADQGRRDEEVEEDEEGEEEEEGAVGGFWDLQLEVGDGESQDAEAQTQFMKQGLDQVPTRLPTKPRSNTPTKDRPTSSRSEHADF